MNQFAIAWRNLWQRPVASVLTMLSMALGVAAVVCVIVINAIAVEQFEQDPQGYHFIVGGNGGDMQLVLTTVYHVGKALPPVSYNYYRDLKVGKLSQYVDVVVPYCLGDSFETGGRLFRVVATTPELFDKLRYDGEHNYQFRDGRNMKPEGFFEAVIGSVVASQGKLKVGDLFNPTHGIDGGDTKHDAFRVVGILEPSGTSNDRAVFVNLEGFFLGADHALSAKPLAEGVEPLPQLGPTSGYNAAGETIAALPDAQREVTAMLVRAKNSAISAALSITINKGEDRVVKAIAPAQVVDGLLEKIVGPARTILLVMTCLIVVVAAIGILVSIYNSMNDRKHDIAVMRALGASRSHVRSIVLIEAVLLSMMGALAGIVLGHLMIGAAGPYVESVTGIVIHMWEFDRYELWLVPSVMALAALVGWVPAWTAYNTDVAKALSGSR